MRNRVGDACVGWRNVGNGLPPPPPFPQTLIQLSTSGTPYLGSSTNARLHHRVSRTWQMLWSICGRKSPRRPSSEAYPDVAGPSCDHIEAAPTTKPHFDLFQSLNDSLATMECPRWNQIITLFVFNTFMSKRVPSSCCSTSVLMSIWLHLPSVWYVIPRVEFLPKKSK